MGNTNNNYLNTSTDTANGKKLKLQWVTDAIGNDYKTKWKPGDYVLITSQTATGKTKFVIDRLVDNGKKFLLISNRIRLKQQIKVGLLEKYNLPVPSDLDELDRITTIENSTVTTYQALSELILNRNYGIGNFSFESYDYVICDEAHFIFHDSSFNPKTQYAYRELIYKHHPSLIMILISATLNELVDVIESKTSRFDNSKRPKLHWYSSGKDYSYLDIRYFKKIDDIVNTIRNDDSNDKWLVFVTSIYEGKRLQKELDGVSDFICAETKNNAELKSIVRDQKFTKKVLIATKTLDNGISLHDNDLQHIVVMAWDETTFIQKIGRKRIDIENAQTVNLYIPLRFAKSFFTKLQKDYAPRKKAVDLLKEDENAFCRKYDNDSSQIPKDLIYRNDKTGKWEVNPIGTWKLDNDIAFAKKMIALFRKQGEYAFVYEQLSWIQQLGTFDTSNLIENVELKEEVIKLEDYLQGMIGKPMLRAVDRAELIEKINVRDGDNNRLLKSIDTLNGKLQERNFKYRIKVFSTSRTKNGKKHNYKNAWKVIKLVG